MFETGQQFFFLVRVSREKHLEVEVYC